MGVNYDSALFETLYKDLRRVALGFIKGERPGHELGAAALVNEAYLRLLESSDVGLKSREEFLAFAARTMRTILVDYARPRLRLKRSRATRPRELSEALSDASPEHLRDIVDIDGALNRLRKIAPGQARVVELRFFLGLDYAEIAEATGRSVPTVKLDWASARAWLHRELLTTAKPEFKLVERGLLEFYRSNRGEIDTIADDRSLFVLVLLRFLGGLSVEQIAAHTGWERLIVGEILEQLRTAGFLEPRLSNSGIARLGEKGGELLRSLSIEVRPPS
jgi:RNA polymerase sigma-70 factor (ECF subfamily)